MVSFHLGSSNVEIWLMQCNMLMKKRISTKFWGRFMDEDFFCLCCDKTKEMANVTLVSFVHKAFQYITPLRCIIVFISPFIFILILSSILSSSWLYYCFRFFFVLYESIEGFHEFSQVFVGRWIYIFLVTSS